MWGVVKKIWWSENRWERFGGFFFYFFVCFLVLYLIGRVVIGCDEKYIIVLFFCVGFFDYFFIVCSNCGM